MDDLSFVVVVQGGVTNAVLTAVLDIPPVIGVTNAPATVVSTAVDNASFVSISASPSTVLTTAANTPSFIGVTHESATIITSATQGPPGAGNLPLFADAEVPTGATDGVNVTYFLSFTPVPSFSLRLFYNGMSLRAGLINDYTLSGNVITMTVPPSPSCVLDADYRH